MYLRFRSALTDVHTSTFRQTLLPPLSLPLSLSLSLSPGHHTLTEPAIPSTDPITPDCYVTGTAQPGNEPQTSPHRSLLVGGLMSQQHASVSQGQICSDNFYVLPHWGTSCRSSNFLPHPVTVCCLIQSQYTDTGPTSPSAVPITLSRVATGVPIFKSLVWLDPGKILAQVGFKPRIFHSQGRRLNHYAIEAFPLETDTFSLHHQGGLLLLLRSPAYISGIHHFWVRFLHMWPFFNPTIKVITFRLHG